MKHFFLLVTVLVATTTLWAYSFTVNDISYSIVDQQNNRVEVFSVSNKCKGAISIPSSVVYNTLTYHVIGVGRGAFIGRSVSSVELPNSVTYIGPQAFDGCTSLSSISLGDSITHIEKYAFRSCTSLTSIVLPESVEAIREGAFNGCNQLTLVNIPKGVMIIGAGAFSDCTSLPVVDKVRYADTYLVEAVDKTLSTYTIKEGIKLIGSYSFYNCTLSSITLPSSVEDIGNGAFNNCKNLKSIAIPDSVTRIGESAFSGCTSLSMVTIGSRVRNIESTAFRYDPIKSVVIPDSVDTLGYRVFADCNKLVSIHIPEGVKSIGDLAFEQCDALTTVSIPNSVNYLGTSAFCDCDQLKTVHLGTQVPKIGNNTFGRCFLLDSVNIPSSVKGIGEWAFGACNSLRSIVIPDSVVTIGKSAFSGCQKLLSINIPKSVDTIGEMAFYSCNSLTSINVDAANKRYASFDGVLFNHAQDTLIQFPSNHIATEYIIPGTIKFIEKYALKYCLNLTSVTMPHSVLSIGYGAFQNSRNIKTIVVSNQLNEVGDYAFESCSSLKAIALPSTLTKIGISAFNDCYSIASIVCDATIPPACGNSCFYNIKKSIPVYVPESSIETYKAAEQWQDFTSFRSATAEHVEGTVTDATLSLSDSTVDITWPILPQAESYTITIMKDDKLVCMLVFNTDGLLVNVLFAPGRGGSNDVATAEAVAGGYKFTITGLNPGTTYNYVVDTKNAAGTSVANYTGTFTTKALTALEEMWDCQKSNVESRKIMTDGQMYILREGKMYNTQGAEL